jgi:curved DNA-binding protein CbpA
MSMEGVNRPKIKTPYELLGIPLTCTQEEIKSAYRKKALETHPDKGGSAEAFRTISEAYDKIKDAEKRASHDRNANSKSASPSGGTANPNHNSGWEQSWNPQEKRPGDAGDSILKQKIVGYKNRIKEAENMGDLHQLEIEIRRDTLFMSQPAEKQVVWEALVKRKVEGYKFRISNAENMGDLHQLEIEIRRDTLFMSQQKDRDQLIYFLIERRGGNK